MTTLTKIKSGVIKQRLFTNYQRMLAFTINLCYRDVDYEILVDDSGYTVRYL